MNEFHLDIVKSLDFNRFGGTADELRAAEIILKYLDEYGSGGKLEQFDIPAGKVTSATLEAITLTGSTTIDCLAVIRSGNLPLTEAELYYADAGEEMSLRDIDGKIVLLNSLNKENYRRLCESKAVGFIIFSGAFNDNSDNDDIRQTLLRDAMAEIGSLPGVSIRLQDALTLVRDGVKRVKMQVEQEECRNPSQNVTSFIEGTQHPEQIIAITAHYDTGQYGHGAWDNASGVSNLLYLYRHFSANPPTRSLRFIWCGSEEQGLLGAKAFVAANAEEAAKTVFCMNFDMTGNILGYHHLITTDGNGLQHVVNAFAREIGFVTKLEERIWPSDGSVFANAGAPTLNVTRNGHAAVHNRHDKHPALSEKYLAESSEFALKFLNRLLGSVEFPIERKIPEKLADELEKYVGGTKTKAELNK